jgi:23S rRNA (uracil1939-C5)-methyltransferase
LTTKDTAPKRRTPLRRGAELELAFTDLLANGQGVGRADGMAVFCFGPLPQERARVRIVDVKPKYAVARLLQILTESPARAKPFCPVFGSCGGCQLQHLAYPAQLRWKRDVVRNVLARIGGLTSVDVAETIGMSEPRAYRNKMSLVVDHRTKPPALGFYRQRSHDVVAIDACPIVTPVLDGALERLAALRDSSPIGDALSEARHIVARSSAASNDLVLTLTTDKPSKSATVAAPAMMRDIPRLAGISNSFDPSSENAILGRRHTLLSGQADIEEVIGGVRYRVSAASFFQINVETVARIFSFLEPWLSPAGRMVDLYCGIGTFALCFAKHGWSVYGVEENAHAVAEASANARRNGLLAHVRFQAGRVERLVDAPGLRAALHDAGVVFLDPPRKGCEELSLAAIARARVPALWYLSCDPATLARDSKYLVANGYRPIIVQPFDMFPQTGHVETLVRFEY